METTAARRRIALRDRLWRRRLALRARCSVTAKASLGRYIAFYNEQRPHSSFDGRTPDAVYFTPKTLVQAA